MLLLIFLNATDLCSETILFIGDSNTRGVPYVEDGWVYKLKNDPEIKKYHVKCENYGFGFATTSQCEQILTELLQHHKYDIIFYNCGLVDVLLKNPLDLVEASMDRSIALCLEHTSKVFFGMIDFTCWIVRRNETDEYVRKANNLFLNMATQHPVIPYIFLTKDLLCHEKCNHGDWIHPNDMGVAIIYENVKQQLLNALKDQK